jgi:hypothetical protein
MPKSQPNPRNTAKTPPQSGGSSKISQQGGETDDANKPIEEVVAEHGPAHHIEIEHDHESGQHHVTSHHGEKHHKSSHGSAKEAHDHAAKAGGAEQDEQMGPDMGQGEPEPAGIPGMSKMGY